MLSIYLFLHSGQVLSSFKCHFKRKYLNLIDSNCDVDESCPRFFVRLHLSADKCGSRLPSLSPYYFNIYFALTDAIMFQNIQQFHSGGSNTNSFRLLATLFITKNSIDMRILSTELSQLKRIAIINAIVFVKVMPLSVLYLEI